MLTFKQFNLFESALERKIQKGFRDTPAEVPGAEVVHHDPESKTTIYHVKRPEGAYALGSRTEWCTATPQKAFAHQYLRKGNLFTILHHSQRFNLHIGKKENEGENEFKDAKNQDERIYRYISMDVAQKLVDIPHTGFKSNYKRPPHPIATAPEKDSIKLIKSQDSKDRMVSYNTMVHGISEHPNITIQASADPTTNHREEAVEERFNANDLHHFHDDPHLPAARLVAQYGDIDKVAHKMKDHSDGEVQRIIKGRVSRAGGEKALIPQRPEPEPTSNDPNQFTMKLPTPKKKV
jgi:hypothetical protein